MILLWLKGLLGRRSGRLAGVAAGVAVTVALLGSLGAFLVSSSATMTARAIAGVPVDWQIQLVPGTDQAVISKALAAAASVAEQQLVGYADAAGFEATSDGTVQSTGPGKVVGLTPDYATRLPGQLRLLAGDGLGALLAQQTAANLHAAPGDSVTIARPGLPAVQVTIAGVVDLPNQDQMFQAVGLPPGAAPQAPPDNVVLLPMDEWRRLFDPQAAVRPDSVRLQLHVALKHGELPRDPSGAYAAVTQAAHNLEARIAGSGTVANNLGARLLAVRGDSLYAGVLFLFLGLPGVLLAALLTLTVALSGAGRRRREQALLRTRGASLGQLMRLGAVEATVVGAVGAGLGLGLALLLSHWLLDIVIVSTEIIMWMGGAVLLGFLFAVTAILVPVWRDVSASTVAASRLAIGQTTSPLWQRLGVDVALLALGGVIFALSASTGYQVVLAPEGVAASSVDYLAFLPPLCLWLGLALLAMRLMRLWLAHGKTTLAALLRPLGGRLTGLIAASLGRQRARLAYGVALALLAISFATATATFNTTYNAQALVDAELTNGSDVTVTGSASAPAASKLVQLAALPGVVAAVPMQHRYAYVGADLQDLYGIDPARIGQATDLSDAYFQDVSAKAALAGLQATPDGLYVSDETVKDFQLKPGDEITLRLQSGDDHQYHAVVFHLLGVAREFPTAPHDSFLIANAAYIAKATGNAAAEIVLLRTSGARSAVKTAAEQVVAGLPGIKVTDLVSAQRLIGSSLTAVDLGALTRLETLFAIVLLAAATGLIFALGLLERQRSFAILTSLGAKSRHIGSFLWSEGLLIIGVAILAGVPIGLGIAYVLVKLLTGVFDPPPEGLSVPWPYLTFVAAAGLASVVAAVFGGLAWAKHATVRMLREF